MHRQALARCRRLHDLHDGRARVQLPVAEDYMQAMQEEIPCGMSGKWPFVAIGQLRIDGAFSFSVQVVQHQQQYVLPSVSNDVLGLLVLLLCVSTGFCRLGTGIRCWLSYETYK